MAKKEGFARESFEYDAAGNQSRVVRRDASGAVVDDMRSSPSEVDRIRKDLPALRKRQPDLFRGAGCLVVSSVAAGSDAARAGLRPGDVVVEYGGKAFADDAELATLLRSGQTSSLAVVVIRGARNETLTATTGRLGAVTLSNLPAMRPGGIWISGGSTYGAGKGGAGLGADVEGDVATP